MLSSQLELRCPAVRLRSDTDPSKCQTSTANLLRRQRIRPCVLIVEYRDEVYAVLEGLLEEHGFDVERAESGESATRSLSRFTLDLVLINEDMPDETGWLITCKLRLTRHEQPVWLYAARQPLMKADWKEFSGVDEVIEYGGVLTRLIRNVRPHVVKWLGGLANEPSQTKLNQTAILHVA